MKKKRTLLCFGGESRAKILLRMKLLTILVFTVFTVSAAETYSQATRFSFKLNDVSVREVFQEIEERSEFILLYNENVVDVNRKINVKVNNETVESILDQVFKGTQNAYKIYDRQIVILEDENSEIPAILKNKAEKKEQQQPTKTISGKITDSDGMPLPGVTVVFKGTTIGTTTDLDGNYSMKVPSGFNILQFSFVGMKTREVTIGNQSEINVSMEAETIGLDEVIAVGYGTMKKSDLTGSVASVRSDQISQVMSTTVEQTLIGRASGVQVTQSEGAPGAGVKIRVRGGTSINASNEPLYVIDGFPVDAGTNSVSSGFSSISGTSVLATMNPNDIESIEVLKDASATAIYGSRGANGVVIITTKSGGGDRQKISFRAYYGISNPSKKLDLLEGDDYIDYFYDAVSGNLSSTSKVDYAARDENNEPIVLYTDAKGNDVYDVWPASNFIQHDWQDEVFRTAATQDYNLSFYGGTKKIDYLASVGYFNQEGIIIGSNYERFTGNFKASNKFSERFNIGINLNSGYTINDGIISATSWGGEGSGVVNNMIYFRPVFGYNDEGEQIEIMDNDRNYDLTNPVKLATQQENLSKNFYLRSNLNLGYEIISGLTFTVKVGTQYSNGKQSSWYPGEFGYGRKIGNGLATLTSSNSVSWLNDNLLTYKNTFNKHRIDAVFGLSQQGQNSESFGLAKTNFEIQSINVDNIGSGTEFYQNGSQSYAESWTLRSWLGRANYTYNEKYLLTVTGRADGSSRFAEGNKWAFFPSAALAWRVAQEPFFENITPVNDLKIHVSYGISGNQGIESYASLAQYNFVEYSYNQQIVKGLRATRLQNNTLTWETTNQLDIGLDLVMFDSRLALNAVYYSKLTDDLLLKANVPYTTGFSSAWKNTGTIENHGLEFSVNTVNIETKDFAWHSNFNISFNNNEVKKLSGDNDYFYASGPGSAVKLQNAYIVKEGEEIGSMFGYVWDGIYQIEDFNYDENLTDPERRVTNPALGGYEIKEGIPYIEGPEVLPGFIRFKDIAGPPDENGNPTGPDGVIDSNDRTIIGHANPDHYGGFSNDFRYKNFELSVLFNWSYGNDVYNKNLAENMLFHTPYHNQLARALDRWTPENPTNDLWGIKGGSSESNSAYIEDGSFLRLSNITLGYNLPKDLMKRWSISNARIFLSGDNLHVWTNYSGYDPEVSVGIASSANPEYGLTPGIDFGAYPRSRTFRMGVQLEF